jgi:hypothetical protein
VYTCSSSSAALFKFSNIENSSKIVKIVTMKLRNGSKLARKVECLLCASSSTLRCARGQHDEFLEKKQRNCTAFPAKKKFTRKFEFSNLFSRLECFRNSVQLVFVHRCAQAQRDEFLEGGHKGKGVFDDLELVDVVQK